MNQLQSFLIALQFLTIIPVRLRAPADDKNISNSLVYYPLVGGLIALILVLSAELLSNQSSLVIAVICLTLWVLLTGGLHLDGLADSADAWLGGLADRDKTLAIMKDPASGPIAVVTMILVLLIKFIMLNELIKQQDWLSIAITIVLARSALPLLFITTPYVRKEGLASLLIQNMPKSLLKWLLLIIIAASLLLSSFTLVMVFLISFLLLRFCMEQRLGGTTGDTAGAMVELIEMTVLITAVII